MDLSDQFDDSLLPDISNTIIDSGDGDSGDDEPDVTEGLSLAECSEKANEHKAEGNTHFVAKRSREALACYDRGVSFVGKFSLEPEARPLLIALHTNSAACHIRLGAAEEEAAKAAEEWKGAIKSANASLDIDYTDKAMFRRGVAHARRGELDEAKTDLTAVCKGDPANREAREELAGVVAVLKERKQQERKAYGSMFSGQSMYREEEIRERRKKEEKQQKKAKEKAEEAKLRQEWRDECDRLRAQGAEKRPRLEGGAAGDAAARAAPELPAEGVEAMSLDTPEAPPPPYEEASGEEVVPEAAASDADKAATKEYLAAAKESEEQADSDDDADEPISFADFKKQKEDAKKEAEEEVKAAKEAALAERQRARAKTDVVRVDDDDELKDVIKGYKKRADGSTTSYFTREVDPETKALLDAQKAPKRIEPAAAAGAPAGAAGGGGRSAWNSAGTTWEEKDVSVWAKEALKARLEGCAVAAGSEGGCGVAVTAVSNLEGSASVVVSRGTTKHLFELACHLEWEAKASAAGGGGGGDGDGGTLAKGVLEYSDVAPSASGVSYEVSERLTQKPKADAADDVMRLVGELKQRAAAAMDAWLAEYRNK